MFGPALRYYVPLIDLDGRASQASYGAACRLMTPERFRMPVPSVDLIASKEGRASLVICLACFEVQIALDLVSEVRWFGVSIGGKLGYDRMIADCFNGRLRRRRGTA